LRRKKSIITWNIIFLLIISFIIFSSCKTIESIDITELKIEKMEVSLVRDGSTVMDSALVPGQVYRIKVRVVSDSYGSIEHPQYTNFIVASPNNSLWVIKKDKDFLVVKADQDVLRLMKSDSYNLSVAVENNPYPKQTFHWGIDWKRYKRLDYTGSKGRAGEEGTYGNNGFPGGGAIADGTDGGPGGTGFRGGPGQEVILCALFYDIRGLSLPGITTDYMLCFYDMTNKKILLAPMHRITVDATGGRGGRGGDGGMGGFGGAAVGDNDTAGDDGEDGDGGNGGPGGDGGMITIFYTDPAVLTYINPVVDGGPGGKGGKGRTDGSSGRKGRPGEINKKRIDLDVAKKIMKETEYLGMEPGRIAYHLPK
jgi:hypothetical protein